MSARPRRLAVVAGIGTEVGKTWVGAAVATVLTADGWQVAARKPAQSAEPGDPAPGDAAVLAAATGEDEAVVCPPHRRYEVAMAPPMAAEVLGRAVPTIDELAGEVAASWPARAIDVGLVELAGGVASPAADDGDGADLAAIVAPDLVILVADAGLGTINAVRLSADRLRARAGTRTVVFLNHYDSTDDLHRRNLGWLATRDGFEVMVDIASLAEAVVALAPLHCGYCGKPATECDRACVRPLDPDHFCVRCGRRLVVNVSPMRHSARCKVHGGDCA